MYKYNPNISQRANESLKKRARVLQLRRQTLVIAGIIIISLAILLGSSISALASAKEQEPLHKYYKSIQVKNGDTLWTIADRFTADGTLTKKKFIQEVCELNHLSTDQIHSGESIVVVYYATSPMYE